MAALINDMFMRVSHTDGVTVLQWKPATADLTDDLFKQEAQLFSQQVQKIKSKRILVDMRGFHYALSPEIIQWRSEHVISVYNAVGVERFAFVSTKPAVNQDNPQNTFITRTFKTEEEAKNWLNE